MTNLALKELTSGASMFINHLQAELPDRETFPAKRLQKVMKASVGATMRNGSKLCNRLIDIASHKCANKDHYLWLFFASIDNLLCRKACCPFSPQSNIYNDIAM